MRHFYLPYFDAETHGMWVSHRKAAAAHRGTGKAVIVVDSTTDWMNASECALSGPCTVTKEVRGRTAQWENRGRL